MSDEPKGLLAAYTLARDAYRGHKKPEGMTPEQEVAFDQEELRLLDAACAAELAYKRALRSVPTNPATKRTIAVKAGDSVQFVEEAGQ